MAGTAVGAAGSCPAATRPRPGCDVTMRPRRSGGAASFPMRPRHNNRRMLINCPTCHHTLPTADQPVRFCPFCGRRLDDPTRPGVEQTPTVTQPAGADQGPAPAQGKPCRQPSGPAGWATSTGRAVGGGPPVALKLLSGRLRANRRPSSGSAGGTVSRPDRPPAVRVRLAADTDQGRPYIVMELMPGDTSRTGGARGRLSGRAIRPSRRDRRPPGGPRARVVHRRSLELLPARRA